MRRFFFLGIVAAMVACLPVLSADDKKEIDAAAQAIARCQSEGRMADAGDHIGAYNRCMKDAGLHEAGQ